MPDNLTLLASPTLEVGVYPSDVSIAGAKADVARARAALASRLTSTAAHLTTSKESQQVEDRLEALADRPPAARRGRRPVSCPTASRASSRRSTPSWRKLDVDYDEWEVLYRMRLQVERDLIAGAPVGEAFPGQVTGPSRAVAGVQAAPQASAAILGAAAMAARRAGRRGGGDGPGSAGLALTRARKLQVASPRAAGPARQARHGLLSRDARATPH